MSMAVTPVNRMSPTGTAVRELEELFVQYGRFSVSRTVYCPRFAHELRVRRRGLELENTVNDRFPVLLVWTSHQDASDMENGTTHAFRHHGQRAA